MMTKQFLMIAALSLTFTLPALAQTAQDGRKLDPPPHHHHFRKLDPPGAVSNLVMKRNPVHGRVSGTSPNGGQVLDPPAGK
jgi:hypothetical protein